MYKLVITNRDYVNYKVISFASGEVQLDLNPFANKLFSEDILSEDLKVLKSPLREKAFIPGILVLKGNKTYGRKNNILLYKFIPNDKSLPIFLVPYKNKAAVNFIKVPLNLYITIQFQSWDKDDKHPYGIIHQIIGDVSSLENYYLYQLYCRNLMISLNKFHSKSVEVLKNGLDLGPTSPNNNFIFTIDPEGSKDLDDAFSIDSFNNDLDHIISIYISHVPMMLDKLKLWPYMTDRVSSIYLPDSVKPMLPDILSNNMCSLLEGSKRFAFIMKIYIYNNIVYDVKYSSGVIMVSKNWSYDDPLLSSDPYYKKLFEIVRKAGIGKGINDSHELVESLMIYMNRRCATDINQEVAIYRTQPEDAKLQKLNNVPTEVITFIGKSAALYCKKEDSYDLRHSGLGLSKYIHITSPIRRLVDILNMIQMNRNFLSKEALDFYEKWSNKLDYINESSKSIRRVQNDCELLYKVTENIANMKNTYEGYVIEVEVEEEDKYKIYIPSLKISTKTKSIERKLDKYGKYMFKLFMFYDEHNLSRKIRAQVV